MTPQDVLEVLKQKESVLSLYEGMKKIASLKPTYCGYLVLELNKAVEDDFDMTVNHYTGSGYIATFVDKHDGREYEVMVRVKPPKESKS